MFVLWGVRKMKKCEHEDEKGNFCGICGEKLRETMICPECGEIEPADRKWCLARVKRINDKLTAHSPLCSKLAMLPLGLAAMGLILASLSPKAAIMMAVGAVIIFICALGADVALYQVKKITRKMVYPDDVAILKSLSRW
jgi:hypothetical protein